MGTCLINTLGLKIHQWALLALIPHWYSTAYFFPQVFDLRNRLSIIRYLWQLLWCVRINYLLVLLWTEVDEKFFKWIFGFSYMVILLKIDAPLFLTYLLGILLFIPSSLLNFAAHFFNNLLSFSLQLSITSTLFYCQITKLTPTFLIKFKIKHLPLQFFQVLSIKYSISHFLRFYMIFPICLCVDGCLIGIYEVKWKPFCS